MLIEQILNSPIKQQISSALSLVTFGELSLLVVKHKACEAIISLQGAQLLHWQPTQANTRVIWLSEKTLFTKHNPIRGGVPICWPNFADFGEPFHGFARLLDWKLIETKEEDDGVRLKLQLTNSDETNHYIGQSFSLELTLELSSDSCGLQLQMQAENLMVTSALHSYFNVSNISNILITGLGVDYQERFITGKIPQKEGQLTINEMVDRIYTSPDPMTIINDIHHSIHINHLNASDLVVWNPWHKKCQLIHDMDADGYKTMVCVETARITEPVQCLMNQPPITLGFIIELITT
ncbi:D-hexose-6-phosphate mutarotase [Entomomonas moraniae]|uniref:Putative glucose-6-phosphate 1-epimerase n=1 Tax=Entomomonas moraniae TaxID=2213226 RepID=A0A3S9XB81_9GAMM|nr:D-hexose-6-phosphate mutarotase [Entomomonas moraniae]AZS49655.1 D-hexose-6-phosphate mutarotase [Entomomonas moraniae]